MLTYSSDPYKLSCNEGELRKRVRRIDLLLTKLVDNESKKIKEPLQEILRNTKKEEICEEKVRFELLAGKKPERCGISPIGKTFSLRHKELLISR
jgi:hypothetical protein